MRGYGLMFAAVWAVGLCALVLAAKAPAHTQQSGGPATYKGHNCLFWSTSIPNGTLYFRECYVWGWTQAGVHYHDYAVDSQTSLQCCKWHFVHWHYGRVVPGHPV